MGVWLGNMVNGLLFTDSVVRQIFNAIVEINRRVFVLYLSDCLVEFRARCLRKWIDPLPVLENWRDNHCVSLHFSFIKRFLKLIFAIIRYRIIILECKHRCIVLRHIRLGRI